LNWIMGTSWKNRCMPLCHRVLVFGVRRFDWAHVLSFGRSPSSFRRN